MTKFVPGDKVVVAIPSCYHQSFSLPEIQGKVGVVEGVIVTDQPTARLVNGYRVKVGEKTVNVQSAHLRAATTEEAAE